MPVCFATIPLVIAGRYRGQPRGGLTITATDGAGRPWTRTVTGTVAPTAALAATWARAHLLDLEDDLDAGLGNRTGLTQHIIDTSLRFHVLCRFTAYVAVDHAGTIDATGRSRRVIQPVDLPAGWDPAAVGLTHRHAAPIAFRTLGKLVGQLEQRVFSITPRPERLRRLHHRVAQLKTGLDRARTLGFSDTDLGPLEAVLMHLQRLLELAKELADSTRRCTDSLPSAGPEA